MVRIKETNCKLFPAHIKDYEEFFKPMFSLYKLYIGLYKLNFNLYKQSYSLKISFKKCLFY